MPKKIVRQTAKQTVKRAASVSTAKTGTARKPAARKSVAAAPKNILTAGIRALSDAHDQAVARQGRVFESLLGLGGKRAAENTGETTDASDKDKSANPLAAALDPFGFRKFEDVFDQRVARSMQHLGVPTTDAFDELKAELERLRARVAALEASGRKR